MEERGKDLTRSELLQECVFACWVLRGEYVVNCNLGRPWDVHRRITTAALHWHLKRNKTLLSLPVEGRIYMQLKLSLAFAALLPLCSTMAICQKPAAPEADPLPQMPGAPGQPTKTLTKPMIGTAVQDPTAADFEFMQGMVMHHSQAVGMVALMKDHTQNPELLELGKRISISQTDEILFMKRWLAIYDKSVPEDGGMAGMAGMDHSKMNMDMPLMPGMLTPQQMDALRKAKGPEFDRLFLTGMIQHHTGALTMVKELFDTQGSGQEPLLFDFTADVDVTQRGEIATMQNMLAKEKQ
jgi:uncharacterized protein (DUF305 family)